MSIIVVVLTIYN